MDCTHWFYLCLCLCGVILAMLAMFFNYSLKLGWRTAKLEKKNGHELKKMKELKGDIRLLKALMTLSEEARQQKLREEEEELESEEEWDNET